MDRRNFFKTGFLKGREAAINVAKVGLKMKYKRHIIRPPGAISEELFLLACTRCGDCEGACPHDAIHLVESVTAGVIVKTPFIDPYFKACQFCEDMPCIQSCKPNALKMPKPEDKLKIAEAHFNSTHCLVSQGQYCDYCFNTCPTGVKALSKAANGTPVIDQELCVGCGKCAYICVSQSGKAIEMKPV